MFQFGTTPRERRALCLGLSAGGTWLVHLGIFAALLWLSARLSVKPALAEKPQEAARVDSALPSAPSVDPATPPMDDGIGCTFGAQLIPPKLLSGKTLEYTPVARAAHVQGDIVAQCTITTEGKVQHCRILKGLLGMNEAAIAALESRRYAPAFSRGRPISMSFAFHIRMTLP
jgi:TonB family protein